MSAFFQPSPAWSVTSSCARGIVSTVAKAPGILLYLAGPGSFAHSAALESFAQMTLREAGEAAAMDRIHSSRVLEGTLHHAIVALSRQHGGRASDAVPSFAWVVGFSSSEERSAFAVVGDVVIDAVQNDKRLEFDWKGFRIEPGEDAFGFAFAAHDVRFVRIDGIDSPPGRLAIGPRGLLPRPFSVVACNAGLRVDEVARNLRLSPYLVLETARRHQQHVFGTNSILRWATVVAIHRDLDPSNKRREVDSGVGSSPSQKAAAAPVAPSPPAAARVKNWRVYEVAKELGLSSEAIMQCLARLAAPVKNHMSIVTPEMLNRLRRELVSERFGEAPAADVRGALAAPLPEAKPDAGATQPPGEQSTQRHQSNQSGLPVRRTPGRAARHIFLDGLNVCMWVSPPSLSCVLVLVEFLHTKGWTCVAIFDAPTRHRLVSGEAELYAEMRTGFPHVFAEVPGQTQADEFLLRRADTSGGAILSNDQFRDYVGEYPWLGGRTARLLKGAVVGDHLTVPKLKADLPLPADARAAWERVRKVLSSRKD